MNRPIRITFLLILIVLAAFASSCSRNKGDIIQEERGMFSQKIRIRSLPTNAKIYINEREVGETPLTYTIRHEDRRTLNIKAVPIYPNQYTQNIFLMVPPIPKTMTIYMNHYPEDYSKAEDRPFSPPEKPLPEVIIETISQVDTVYITELEVERTVLNLPVIFFDTASYQISPDQIAKLHAIKSILDEDPAYYLEIYGYADRRASDSYNQRLTLNRANSVKDYLVSLGVDPSRLYTFGYGRVNLVTSSGVEDDLQLTRRVNFLLKKSE